MRPDGTVEHDVGVIRSADLLVNPNASSAQVNMTLGMNTYGQRQGGDLTASGSATLSTNTTNFAGNLTVFDCAPSCNQHYGTFNGLLIGASAEHAGLSVGINHPEFGGIGASAVLDRGANAAP